MTLASDNAVAIGMAAADPQRAGSEIRALLRGQWANGMLPHMVFAPGVHDVGSNRIWQSRRHPDAPRDIDTSCITQPPLVAIATWHVAIALPPDERVNFLGEVYPRLVDYHRWLYRERDLHGRGLVTLIHPWESGLDSTPPWMQELARMPVPWWVHVAVRLRLARVLRFLRRDTRLVPAAERASDDDGLRMLVLIRRAKRYGFELRRIPPHRAPLIEDVAFNALLAAANESLGYIAGELGTLIDPELARSFTRTTAAMNELWDDDAGQYFSRNATTGTAVDLCTVATFLPLWAGLASPAQATRLVERLRAPSGFWPRFPVPSVPTDAPYYEPDRYWKGPTWVNMNWVIIEGLRRYRFHALADELRDRTLDLVDEMGFAEYFSALTGTGFGADDFSWTAALVLALATGEGAAPTARP